MMSMSAQKKSKYKEYGSVYAEQCVHCIKEGTYHCRLEITSDGCRNYVKHTKQSVLQFGGY